MKTWKLTSSVKMTSPPGTGGASELYVADGFNLANRKRACNNYKCRLRLSESACSTRVETSVRVQTQKKCIPALHHRKMGTHIHALPQCTYTSIEKQRKLFRNYIKESIGGKMCRMVGVVFGFAMEVVLPDFMRIR